MPDEVEPGIENAMLRGLYAYWTSCRRARAFPRRADFDPAAIGPMLPHVFLVDVERGETMRFRLRLVGTFLQTVFRGFGSGRYLDDAFINRKQPGRLDPYRQVAADARPSVQRSRFIDDNDLPYDYERLLLPLARADEMRVDMIVGGIAFDRPLPTPRVDPPGAG
jgi:hypothetical protein